jgi:hypothetical protein
VQVHQVLMHLLPQPALPQQALVQPQQLLSVYLWQL